MRGPRHVVSVQSLDATDLAALLQDAVGLKREPSSGSASLGGHVAAVMFDRQSLRTRLSFDLAMYQLGGRAVNLPLTEMDFRIESPADLAGEVGRWVDVVIIRTGSHATLEEYANHSPVPVINARSDLEHPCQALADMFTILESKGALRGVTVVYVGEGGNVANSLVLCAPLAGLQLRLCCPEDRPPRAEYMEFARRRGASITIEPDPFQAAQDVDVIYTDAWDSAREPGHRDRLERYTVDIELLARARPDAVVMHPMPARRGQEISAEVLDGPRSIALTQAENRLHMQKAILRAVLERCDWSTRAA